MRFGTLLVLRAVKQNAYTGRSRWLCLCDCSRQIERTRFSERSSCGYCSLRESSHGERAVTTALAVLWPDFVKAEDFLKGEGKKPLDLDSYSASLSVAVAFNGEQHYKPKFGIDALGFQRLQEADRRRRRRLCKAQGIHLIEIHHKDYDKDPEGTIKRLIEEVRRLSENRTPARAAA